MNKAKMRRSRCDKGYYAAQFQRTLTNKARRATTRKRRLLKRKR